MAIGSAKDMIDKGAWQTVPQPKLPKKYCKYKVKFRFGFYYNGFKFLCEYLLDKETNDTLFFIYPKTSEFYGKILVFSDIIKQSKYWQTNIYDISNLRNDKLKKFFITEFRQNKIFFSDDLTGTDFKQACNFEIRR